MEIDLEKLICDFLSFEYKGEELKDLSRAEIKTIKSAIWFVGRSLRDALEKQGYEYKEGAIVPIESMPEFKEGDILYNKDSYASDSIFIFKGMSDKTNAYLCYARLYDGKTFSVYSKEVWDKGVGIYGGEFYPANHKQKELLFSKMEEAGYKWNPDTLTLEKVEKPSTIKFEEEPVFDGMVYEYIKSKEEAGITGKELTAYRQGLEDMYKRLSYKK